MPIGVMNMNEHFEEAELEELQKLYQSSAKDLSAIPGAPKYIEDFDVPGLITQWQGFPCSKQALKKAFWVVRTQDPGRLDFEEFVCVLILSCGVRKKVGLRGVRVVC